MPYSVKSCRAVYSALGPPRDGPTCPQMPQRSRHPGEKPGSTSFVLRSSSSWLRCRGGSPEACRATGASPSGSFLVVFVSIAYSRVGHRARVCHPFLQVVQEGAQLVTSRPSSSFPWIPPQSSSYFTRRSHQAAPPVCFRQRSSGSGNSFGLAFDVVTLALASEDECEQRHSAETGLFAEVWT